LVLLERRESVMFRRKAFTLVELLVVIAVIAILMAILLPALERARQQSQEVVCMSNIKQWSYCWLLYLNDHEGMFPSGDGASGDWPDKLRPYYKERGALTLCPSATTPYTEGGVVPFGAWRWVPEGGGWTNFEDLPGEDYGSYGLNEWLGDRPDENFWGNDDQEKANNIPMFFDCVVWDIYCDDTDAPPDDEGIVTNEMHLVCINRHNGYINTVFLDLDVRKVGLKELWTLKWHREFNTRGPWTKAGGVKPEDWPEWMRKFRDY
jgi:prepilin-type N-terminal cleavage/methylation domain-containing protein